MYACFTLSNVPTLSYVFTHADQVHLELLEVLELYCETLHARFALLELKKYVAFDFFFSCASTYSIFLVSTEPDDAIREPMLAVIHAAHRTELQELHVLKDMLSARYGSEFADAALENPDGRVPERITRKLAFSMPSPELVDAYLTESMCDSAGEGRLTNLFFFSVCRAYQVQVPAEVACQNATDTEASFSPDTCTTSSPPASTRHTVLGRAPTVATAVHPQDNEWHALMQRFNALKR